MFSSVRVTEDTYSQQLNYNKPNLLNNIGNTIKRAFRYTIYVIKAVFRFIKSILFSNEQDCNKKITVRLAIRVSSAKDMSNKNWLMLGNNKDIRLYRSNMQEMLKSHLKATTFTLYNDKNDDIKIALVNDKSTEKQTSNYELYTVASSSANNNEQKINAMVSTMFKCLLDNLQNGLVTAKKIQVIIELPHYIKSTEDIKTYYHACNQMMISFKNQLNIKVVLLTFVKEANNFKKIEVGFHKSYPQNNSTHDVMTQESVKFKNLDGIEENINNNDNIEQANKELACFRGKHVTQKAEQHYSDAADLVADVVYLDCAIPIKIPEYKPPSIDPVLPKKRLTRVFQIPSHYKV